MYLYIMGRPHCGSTILNILLGNSASVVAVGQLVSDLHDDHRCSCGATLRQCPFWSEVRRRVEADGADWQRVVAASVGQAHPRAFLPTLLRGAAAPRTKELVALTETLAKAITGTAGRPVICDSSKEATRALFLARFYREARIIFLVRDPRSAVASHYWRFADEQRFHFLRRNHFLPRWAGPAVLLVAAASWTIGNLLSEIVKLVAPGRVLLIRCEDLRDRPGAVLADIAAGFGLELGDAIAKAAAGAAVEVGHNLGGNDEVRLQPDLRFDPARERARRRLPVWLELGTVALCWPLMLRYGYWPHRRLSRRRAVEPEPT